MRQLRPIILCFTFYKIIAKILSKRLSGIIGKLISENQNTFIIGKLISNNIQLAQEVIHHLKNKKLGSKCEMAIKLDMTKAIDQ